MGRHLVEWVEGGGGGRGLGASPHSRIFKLGALKLILVGVGT